jgi:hypothetical protein
MTKGCSGFCECLKNRWCFPAYLFHLTKCFIISDFKNRQLLPTRQPGISPRWASLRTVTGWILSNVATCRVVRLSSSFPVFFAAMIRPYGKAFGPIWAGGLLKRNKRARMRVAEASVKRLIRPSTRGFKQKPDKSLSFWQIHRASRADEREASCAFCDYNASRSRICLRQFDTIETDMWLPHSTETGLG